MPQEVRVTKGLRKEAWTHTYQQEMIQHNHKKHRYRGKGDCTPKKLSSQKPISVGCKNWKQNFFSCQEILVMNLEFFLFL